MDKEEQTPEQVEESTPYRGFDDEFKTYHVGEIRINVPKLSFNETEKLEKIADEFNEQVHKFNKKEITRNDLNAAKTKFIKEGLSCMLPKDELDVLLNNVDKPTLFGVTKDLFAFLQEAGSVEEVKLLLTLSKQMSQMS